MKLSVSTIMRPSTAVEPSGHWNEIDQRAEATCSWKPFAAHATPGTTSSARAASRAAACLDGRGGLREVWPRDEGRAVMTDLLRDVHHSHSMVAPDLLC